MIFKREWVAELMRTGRALDARPMTHRNGHPLSYKVGGVYPVQPGRFQLHVAHVEVMTLDPTPVAVLRADGGWELPASWSDDLIVGVMELRLRRTRGLCCAPFDRSAKRPAPQVRRG